MPLSPDPLARYRLPGQNLYAPVLDRPDFSGLNDDSAPGFDADNQIQSNPIPDPAPIPTPAPLRATGPGRQVATAPPPAPSADPGAYSRLKDVPPPTSTAIAPSKPSAAAPPPPPPPVSAPPSAAAQDVNSTMDRLRNLKPPAPPGKTYDAQGNIVDDASQKPSWARRLLAAIGQGISTVGEIQGRVRPGAAQEIKTDLLYPGYGRSRAAYETQRGDIENQLNEALKEKQIEAQEEQRAATAEWRKAQAANISQAEQDRADAAKQRIGQQTRETNRKFLEDRLKGREGDATYQGEADQRPPGWEFIPDPEKPGFGFAVPPAWMKLPPDLKVPGRQAGDMVPWSEFRAAENAAQKVATKPPIKEDAIRLAITAAGGDPDKPETITPDVAKKALAQQKQGSAVQLTPEAIDFWGNFARTTGQVPSLGMGTAGAGARSEILNKAAETGGNVAANKAQFQADSDSLKQTQKMRDSVVAFENTALANLDLFSQQAKNVIDSGSPWINKPLRSISRNLLGSQDQAAFDTARQVALTEIAKVVNNPNLTGQLSDQARREVMELNPSNATLAQLYRTVGVLKQDMANRHQALDRQIGEIQGRLKGGQSGAQQPGSPSPAPAAPKPTSYKFTATNPQGHKIGSNDQNTWYDLQTGQPVK